MTCVLFVSFGCALAVLGCMRMACGFDGPAGSVEPFGMLSSVSQCVGAGGAVRRRSGAVGANERRRARFHICVVGRAVDGIRVRVAGGGALLLSWRR